MRNSHLNSRPNSRQNSCKLTRILAISRRKFSQISVLALLAQGVVFANTLESGLNLSQNSLNSSQNSSKNRESNTLLAQNLSPNSTLLAQNDSLNSHQSHENSTLLAQNDSENSSQATTYTLDAAVISATGYEQEIKHAPASISIIDKEEILSKPVRDLGDIVADVPGVAITTAKTGASNISMRGLGSAYTLILVDGKRVNISQGFDGQGFDSTSGFIPPNSQIERVEVIKGPASTIYGSDAMGGVINIITKKRGDEFRASVGLETRLQEDHSRWGNTYGINGDIFAPLGEKFSLNLRGKYNYGEKNRFYIRDIKGYIGTITNPYTSHSPDRYINYNFGARLNFTPNAENSFYLDADYAYQELGSLNTSAAQVNGVRKYVKQNYILNHDGDYSFGKFNSFLHYAVNNRYTKKYQVGNPMGHSSLIYNPIFTYQTSFTKNFDSAILNTGINYLQERLYSRITGINESGYILALFAESENFLHDNLSTTGGVRVNYAYPFGVFTSPRFFVNLYPTSWLTFKIGVASGLQVPSLANRFDGLYTTNLNSNIDIYGNKDLVPEKSVNYELSSLIDAHFANFTLTGFVTEFSDAIDTTTYQKGASMPRYGICDGNGAQNGTCTMPENVDKARIYGVEFEFKTSELVREATMGFGLDFSYGLAKSKRLTGSEIGTPLNDVPMHTVSANLNYKPSYLREFHAFLRYAGKYKTTTYNQHTANAGPGKYFYDTHIVDLGASYKLGKFTLGVVINNLFDFDTIDYFTYQGTRNLSYSNSYQRMIPGRNYWVNLRAEF